MYENGDCIAQFSSVKANEKDFKNLLKRNFLKIFPAKPKLIYEKFDF